MVFQQPPRAFGGVVFLGLGERPFEVFGLKRDRIDSGRMTVVWLDPCF